MKNSMFEKRILVEKPFRKAILSIWEDYDHHCPSIDSWEKQINILKNKLFLLCKHWELEVVLNGLDGDMEVGEGELESLFETLCSSKCELSKEYIVSVGEFGSLSVHNNRVIMVIDVDGMRWDYRVDLLEDIEIRY